MSDHNIEQIDQILLSFVRLDEIKIQELLSYDPSRELLTQLIQIFDNGTKEILQQVKSEFEINNLATYYLLRSVYLSGAFFYTSYISLVIFCCDAPLIVLFFAHQIRLNTLQFVTLLKEVKLYVNK